MPELPEVETVARQLDPLLRGRVVRRLEILDHKRIQLAQPTRVNGLSVRRVFRSGKQVVLELESSGTRSRSWLVAHLGMTGRLVFHAQRISRSSHLRARMMLTGGTLCFIDPRRFGKLRLVDDLEDLTPIGRDPLDRRFTPQVLSQLLRGSHQAIKVWLMRQDRLVGLGNIYASEILFASALHPERAAGALDETEVERLHHQARRILRAAIRHAGTTFQSYRDARGQSGSYQRHLAVYGRAGQPCPSCGASVTRSVQQGRSTFHCERCQPCRGRG